MSDYLKEGFIDEVKGCLGGRGSGQENVIESIKVNGVGQTVDENKAVNIPVPTKTSDLDNDSGYITEDQVNSKVTEGVASIVANAPEDFDTLKEMSDWISQHEDSAAAMNSAILKNKEDIEALQTSKADVSDVQTVEASVDELNSNLDGLGYGENGAKNLFEDEIKWMENITVTRGTKSVSDGKITLTATSYDCYTDHDVSSWKNNGIKTIPCKPNKKYTLSWEYEGDSEGNVYVFENGSTNNMSYNINKAHKLLITTSADAEYLTFRVGVSVLGTSITYWNFQLEEGDTATPYKPYIQSVKMLAEEVSAQNESLDSQGLLNKFDGKLEQGYKNASGTIIWDSTNVCIKNTISVSSGDKVTVKLDSVATRLYTTYRNNGVFVSEEINYNTNNVTVTIPSGANGLDITMVYDSTTTPSQVGNLYVYINNAIDEIKNDLIILESSTEVDMTANRELDDYTKAITIPSGYKPIAMYAYNSNNNDNISAIPLLLRSDGRVLYHAKNHSASDQGVIGFVIRITFKRVS